MLGAGFRRGAYGFARRDTPGYASRTNVLTEKSPAALPWPPGVKEHPKKNAVYICGDGFQTEIPLAATSKKPAAGSTGQSRRHRRTRGGQAESGHGFETLAKGKRTLA